MQRVLWICAEVSQSSAELRRLLLPALLVEEHGWNSQAATVETLGDNPDCDIAVISANALSALARVASWEKRPSVLIELDDATVQYNAAVLDSLTLAAGRFDAIVSRGPLAAAWARDVLASRVAHTTIPD